MAARKELVKEFKRIVRECEKLVREAESGKVIAQTELEIRERFLGLARQLAQQLYQERSAVAEPFPPSVQVRAEDGTETSQPEVIGEHAEGDQDSEAVL